MLFSFWRFIYLSNTSIYSFYLSSSLGINTIFIIIFLHLPCFHIGWYYLILLGFFYRLQRFEKTNEMLSNCNSLSATRFALAQKEFKKHTALLVDMKKDLDNVFKRIRTIKTKLSNQYPAAFTGVYFSKRISYLCYRTSVSESNYMTV